MIFFFSKINRNKSSKKKKILRTRQKKITALKNQTYFLKCRVFLKIITDTIQNP